MPKLKRGATQTTAARPISSRASTAACACWSCSAAASSPMTLSDLAKAADLPRATARRILFTLERGGFVASDGKLFRLTPHVLVLASSYLASNHVVSVLQPVLDRLRDEAQEICSMAMLDGNDVVFIARASPTRVFSSGIDIGYRLPAFCTSVGRALLVAAARRRTGREPSTAMDLAPLTPHHRHRPEAVAEGDRSPIAPRAIRWSIARPSRDSVRSPCRSAATTAPSSPPSTWARMSTASRPPR